MLPETTRVPAVIDALIVGVNASMPDLQVVDGPPGPIALHDDVLAVGFRGPEGTSANASLERQPGYGNRELEVFEIFCTFSSAAGDVAMKPRRDTCQDFLVELDALLKADQTLGGVADVVTLTGTVRWSQDQTPDGAVCDVAFSVAGKALL